MSSESTPPLPLVTPELPGTGGSIKATPADFVVEELPLYELSGEGEHVYLRIRREGRTTHELVRALGALFDLPGRAIGVAGRKDKHARATQTFSLHLHRGAPEELAARVASELGVEVLDARRHANKLKRGHLAGNRFEVRLTGILDPELALGRARAIAAALERRGLPNYFGPQRFGGRGENPARGLALLARVAAGGRRPRGDRDGLMLSAWQSELFNRWLAARVRAGAFEELLDGDLAQKTDTGGLFPVEDRAAEAPRFEAREITYTGPMFGARMRRPTGLADELERAVLARETLDAAGTPVDERLLARAGLDGTRRAARIAPHGLAIDADGDALRVRVELPKGAYATTLLAELVKDGTAAGAPATA